MTPQLPLEQFKRIDDEAGRRTLEHFGHVRPDDSLPITLLLPIAGCYIFLTIFCALADVTDRVGYWIDIASVSAGAGFHLIQRRRVSSYLAYRYQIEKELRLKDFGSE